MKLIKRLLVVFAAFVLAFSVFALSASACNPSDNTDNTDNNGGNNGGNNNEEDDITGPSVSPNASLINAVYNQSYVAASFTGKIDITREEALFSVSENGGKGEQLKPSEVVETMHMFGSGNVNLADADADLVVGMENHYASNEEPDLTLINILMRGGEVFTAVEYDDDGNPIEIKDYTGIDLHYEFNLIEELIPSLPGGSSIRELVDGLLEEIAETNGITIEQAEELLDEELAELGITVEELRNINPAAVLTEYALNCETFIIMSLTDNFGALKVENSTATADLLLMAQNIVKEAKDFVNSINGDTTIGDLLNNKAVKGVLEPLLNVIEPEIFRQMLPSLTLQILVSTTQSQDALMQLLEIYNSVDWEAILVEPDEGATTYDYLIKFISSEALRVEASKVIAALENAEDIPQLPVEIELPVTLDKMTIDYFVRFSGHTLAELKEEVLPYLDCVTENGVVLSSEILGDNMLDVEIAEAKIIYTLNGKKVTGQRVKADFVTKYYEEEYIANNGEITYIWNEESVSCTFDGNVIYTDTEYELYDVSNNLEKALICGTYYFESLRISSGGEVVEIKVGEEYSGLILSERFYVLELYTDGTYILTANYLPVKGRWELRNGVCYLSDTIECTIDGSRITIKQEDGDIVLRK